MTDNTWPTVDTELIDDVTLYSAKLIIPVTGPVIIDGAVAIHGDRVVHVGKRRWVLKALKQFDGWISTSIFQTADLSLVDSCSFGKFFLRHVLTDSGIDNCPDDIHFRLNLVICGGKIWILHFLFFIFLKCHACPPLNIVSFSQKCGQ